MNACVLHASLRTCFGELSAMVFESCCAVSLQCMLLKPICASPCARASETTLHCVRYGPKCVSWICSVVSHHLPMAPFLSVFAPSDMLVALTTKCTWQFVGGLCLRLLCFVSSAHVAARCASTRCQLRFCFFSCLSRFRHCVS